MRSIGEKSSFQVPNRFRQNCRVLEVLFGPNAVHYFV